MIALRRFQEDWATSTSAPLALSPDGGARAPESDFSRALLESVDPGTGPNAAARLSAYRFQYWFRLLTLLQKDFPLVGHLEGWTKFNLRAAPYLQAHPPQADLGRLGSAFPDWLSSGRAPSTLVEAARVDLAWSEAFLAYELPLPTAADLATPDSLLDRLGLQPAVRVLRLSRNWFPLKSSLESGVPVPPGPPPRQARWWAISRTGSVLRAEPVEPALAEFLGMLFEGSTRAALERLARSRPAAVRRIPDWFRRGAELGWWGVSPIP